MPAHSQSSPATLADAGPVRLIVLAGQSETADDPLAERFDVSHRCLIPLAGQPLIAHVLQTGAHHPKIGSLAVCIERAAFDPVWDVLTRLPGRGAVSLVEARDDLASSIRAAAQGWDGPLLITTADHALLSAQSIDAVLEILEKADIALALAPRNAVEAVHPSGATHYLPLRDGPLATCDLYATSGVHFLKAASIFRGRSASRAVGLRLVRALGPIGLLLMWLGFETLPAALERASRRLHARVRAIILPDGTQAIDVGDERSYAIVRHLLEERERESALDTPAATRFAGDQAKAI